VKGTKTKNKIQKERNNPKRAAEANEKHKAAKARAGESGGEVRAFPFGWEAGKHLIVLCVGSLVQRTIEGAKEKTVVRFGRTEVEVKVAFEREVVAILFGVDDGGLGGDEAAVLVVGEGKDDGARDRSGRPRWGRGATNCTPPKRVDGREVLCG
jgi:hypothetical protein